MSKPIVIIVAGPTAVGKTAMAIRLAKHFDTAIISADSRQCYRELNIGVSKPTVEELEAVPHFFINSHSIHQKVDAAIFEDYALTTAKQLFKHHEVVIMIGGTGMYIKAFCEGLDAIPSVSEEIQKEVRNAYTQKGLEWLQAVVAKEDSEYFTTGETENPQRLMRALEVKRTTGKSIRYYQRKKTIERPFRVIKTALQLPREMLNERISHRVNKMVAEGLVQEAEGLLPYQQLNALQTVGYQELFDYFAGNITLNEAVEQVKIHTRQYAKRQMTWFSRDKQIKWFEGGDCEGLQHFVKQLVQ